MSRVFLGVALGLLLAGLLVVVLEKIKRSYNKGRKDSFDEYMEAEFGPVDSETHTHP